MEFLKIKVYRNNFVIYISTLLVVCVVLGFNLCGLVVRDQVQKNENAAQASFDKVEASFDMAENKIDNYVLYLYSSKQLLRDFVCFFGNDVETYLTKRLDSSDGNTQIVSVLDDMQRFVSDNQYDVREVAFQAPDRMNLMYFTENQGTSFLFSQPVDSPLLKEDDLRFGYIYTKTIMSPRSIAKPMGSLRFVINAEKSISGLLGGSGHIAVMSGNSSLYYPAEPGKNEKELLQQIYSGGNVRGSRMQSPFNTVYYSVFVSKTHGYRMIATIDTKEIFRNNRALFLQIVLGTFFLFALMFAVIAAFMARDAKYLNKILVTIGEAKSGNFKRIELGGRRDELRMIAQELDDMSAQLNHYIETEYKLKIRQKDTEMKMLQRQVNPHFLYNTLEIIRSCALVNRDEQVADAISNLGAMFRDIVKKEDVIPFSQEVEILKRYLKIMEFKFSGTFFYQIDIPEEIGAVKTVKFWLQPLCENFFVHGFDRESAFNLLLVRGLAEPDGFRIEIANNGSKMEEVELRRINDFLQGCGEDTQGKIGMMNVYTRLRYFYGDRVAMSIANNAEAGVTISVRIRKEDNDVSNADRG